MKRFHLDHEGVLPDDSVVALWRGNEGLSSAPFALDSSYSANFSLGTAGATAGFKNAGFFGTVSAGSGARFTGEAGTGWLQSGASGASPGHLYCTSVWSISMWTAVPSTTVTQCLLEFASTSTVVDAAGCSPLGIYRLANGNLRVQWDLDHSAASLGHFCDFPTGLTSANLFRHVGITKADCATVDLREVSVYVDGALTAATYMIRPQNPGTSGASGRWVIGASRRFGTAAGATPAMAQSVFFDDLAFYRVPLTAPKMLELYRNGVRSWGEKNLYESGSSVTKSRVLVEDGDGVMVDLSNLYDTNWVKSVDTKAEVDQQIASVSISLMRMRGASLNLSPLAETSVLNLNASSTFEALLDLRRKVRVETATVPAEWRVQGWEWEPLFEGFVDGISWETDTVKLECLDRTAPLSDTFQLDPRAYDYYNSQPLAETHIQTLIANNNPSVKTGVDVLDVGYKGGTPLLYTPASSGWALNYDDTPSGDVAAMVQSVADQIGWSVRHKWYDPWQTDRLTFYGPPRLKSLDIAMIETDPEAGYIIVTTRTHHGLIEGQSIAVTHTTNFNESGTVEEILAYNKFRFYVPPPTALAAGGIFLGDPDDATLLTLTGSSLDRMGNQLGGLLNVGGVAQTGVKPTIQTAVVNGLDVVRFIKSGALSGSDTNFVSNTTVTSIANFFGAGALTTKTMQIVINLTGISTSSLANLHPDADCVFAWMNGGTIIFGLWLREDAGVYYAVIANNDGSIDKVEIPITLSTWLVLTLWHDGTNIKIKLDDGAWSTPVASGVTFADANDGHFGYNSHSAKGFAGDVAYLVTYNSALSDTDVNHNVTFLQNRFGL